MLQTTLPVTMAHSITMHISLYVTDIQQTIKFYQALFGPMVVADKVRLGYAKFELADPALVISFVENRGKVQPKFGHLGFRVDTLEALTDKLNTAKANGMNIREELDVTCCYAVQDKFWVSDPDGYQWEIYRFKADAEFNDPHMVGDACCIASATPALTTIADAIMVAKPEANTTCSPTGGCC